MYPPKCLQEIQTNLYIQILKHEFSLLAEFNSQKVRMDKQTM